MKVARRRGRRSWWLIPMAAAIAVVPMCLYGPSYGHDFNFHLLNWMEAARQFGHGTLYPRWAFSPAYNAGEPRFVFYPPASWSLGAFFSLVLTHLPVLSLEGAWTAVPIVFTAVCLTGAGAAMYVAARRFATHDAAVIGAVLYVVNPYMLFTAYERSAYAELLAAAWMPLMLSEVLSPKVNALGLAIPIALLWLTNAPAAVIGCYAVVGFVTLRLITEQSSNTNRVAGAARQIALPAAAGLILGLGLSAFYLVPAAWERRYVQVAMATIVDMRIDRNFLFEYTGNSAEAIAHDQVLRTASWIAVSLIVAAVLAICTYLFQQRNDVLPTGLRHLPAPPLLGAIAVIAFLLTGWSNAVWQHTPELVFLQFPWRLLTVIAPVFGIAVAAACSGVQLRWTTTAAIAFGAAALLTAGGYRDFHQAAEAGQAIPTQLHAFVHNAGAEPTDEYTPETADNDALTPGNPPYWFAAEPTASRPQRSTPGPVPMHFTLNAPAAGFVVLNLRDYPAWRITLNEKLESQRGQRDDGLVALAVPQGSSTVDIRHVRGVDDWVGDAVSVISIASVLAVRRRRLAA